MFRKQLVFHVTSELSKDTPEDRIRNDLLKDGWSEKDIQEAFFYSMFPEKLRHFSLSRFFRSEMPRALAIPIALIFLISFAVFSFYFRNKVYSYTIFIPTASEEEKIEWKYGDEPALSNPDFFKKVKNQFISEKANFIEADLSAMLIRAYKSGERVLEVPIKTKGREGSWWETPAGLYKIERKEKTHFSGMGHVYQPWSMAFQGNFYIHGWPYYPDRTPVSSQYSGGCVRLLDEDAKKLYDEAEIGMPVLVFKQDFAPDGFVYKKSEPELLAKEYLVADLKNNFVFLKKDSSEKLPIASIVKLVTALVTTEYINLDNVVMVPKEAVVFTSKPRLKEGMEISIYQLLFPLLLESSNESAEAIAQSFGRENFIKKMNEKALSMGMINTHFTDPSGSSEENISTPEDLFMLAKYIYNNRSFIWNITSGKIKNSAYGETIWSNLSNLNDLNDNPYFFGAKVGKTSVALETGLFVFEVPVGNVKRPVAVIILGSPDRKSDTSAVLDYLKSNFEK